MAWQCRLIENPFREGGPGSEGVQIGDMWFDDWKIRDDCPPFLKADLSDEYRRDWLDKRPPIIVAVPSVHFPKHPYRLIPIDEHYQRGPGIAETHGWAVTGEAPHITCSPSINAVGDFHGWLRDGVISDDVEGRKYP